MLSRRGPRQQINDCFVVQYLTPATAPLPKVTQQAQNLIKQIIQHATQTTLQGHLLTIWTLVAVTILPVVQHF